MGFIRKIWQDRVSTFPNRRKIKDTLTNEEKIVLIERYEGDVSNSGTELSASSFNDLEVRIENAFIAEEKRINEEVIPSIENVNSAVSNLGNVISKGDSDTLVKANKYTDDKIGDVDLSGIAVNAEAIDGINKAISEIQNEETGILKQSKDYTDEKIGDVDLSGIATNAEAIEETNNKIAEIRDTETGILAQSQKYTDEKIGDVDLSGIASNAEAIAAINNEQTGILKQSKDYTDEQLMTVVIERSPTVTITSIEQPTILKDGDTWEQIINGVEIP